MNVQALLSLEELPPLVLITGGCEYDREEILQKLSPTQTVLGEDVTPKSLSEELTSSDLFSTKRTLVIRHVTRLDAASVKVLLSYAAKPDAGMTLICEGESRSASLSEAFKAGGVHVDLGHLPPWEEEKAVVSWLCRESGGKLSSHLARRMVEQVGVEKRVLQGELEKLLCYLGERPALTAADLDALLVGNPQGSVWELGRAIMGRDPKRALAILSKMGEGMGLFGTLAALRSQFQSGLICATLAGQPAEIQKALPKLKGRQLERLIELAQKYGEARFRKGLLKIGDLEHQAKSQMLPERLALEVATAELASA